MVRVVRPCIGLCSKLFSVEEAAEKPLFTFPSVKFFHVGLRVSFFGHALLVLLVLALALHDRSVFVFLFGN